MRGCGHNNHDRFGKCRTCRNDRARRITAENSLRSIAWADETFRSTSNRGDQEEAFTRREILQARGYGL